MTFKIAEQPDDIGSIWDKSIATYLKGVGRTDEELELLRDRGGIIVAVIDTNWCPLSFDMVFGDPTDCVTKEQVADRPDVIYIPIDADQGLDFATPGCIEGGKGAEEADDDDDERTYHPKPLDQYRDELLEVTVLLSQNFISAIEILECRLNISE